VRCSACGAARTDNAERCPYCQAEFTLHERDLDTVCPHCFALVSDQARFCHHCGGGLVPELDAGAATRLLCPACGEGHHLVSRRLGSDQVTVLECDTCAGFWMGHEAFRQLVERAQREALPAGTTVKTPQQISASFGLPSTAVAKSHTRARVVYRPCAVCGELMNRINYGRESGVIIDVCREHGIWFDADELARILAWLRAGGSRKPVRDIPLFQPPEARSLQGPDMPMRRPSFLEALLDFLLGSSRDGF
jgi:Zn-finger nucleic acid-binding protein